MQMLMKSDGYRQSPKGCYNRTGLHHRFSDHQKIGAAWLDKILPPIVVGPVIMVIGLGLAANAAQNAMYNGDIYDFKFILVALVTLGLTIFFNMFLRGFSWLDPHLTRDHWWLLSSFSCWDRRCAANH